VDWAVLNPSDDEVATLKKKGFQILDVKPSAFRRDLHAPSAKLLPFYWGFDVGLDVPTDDVYRMLTIIEKHSAELAQRLHNSSQSEQARPEPHHPDHQSPVTPPLMPSRFKA
jgi:hypothetical protein